MGREFDPAKAGGPVRVLSTSRLRVTSKGIDVVVRHISRFGDDEANHVMVERLRRITAGEIGATQYDLHYYAHELREFVRYRREGFPDAAGDDYALWNNAHAAALDDYLLQELDAYGNRNLFHPGAWPLLPH